MKIRRTVSPAAAGIRLDSLVQPLRKASERTLVERRKDEIRQYFGVRHVYMVSSGKAALTLILLALKSLRGGTKVLIPAYTCFSVPSSIVRAGMHIQLCDIDFETFDYDRNILERSVDDETACIVAIDLFGIPSNIERLRQIGKRENIYIIEDAAQAMGVHWEGEKLGARADVGFFSLGRGKNITCGSGGIILTDCGEIANAIEKHLEDVEEMDFRDSLANYLKTVAAFLFVNPRVYWVPSGIPSLRLGETFFCTDFPVKRLSWREAAILHGWRNTMEEWNEKRRENALYFMEALKPKLRCSPSIPYLRLPFLADTVEERDRISALSRERGLGVVRMYPSPVNEIPEIRDAFQEGNYPVSKYVADRLLTIPTHPFLSDRDREAICRLFH